MLSAGSWNRHEGQFGRLTLGSCIHAWWASRLSAKEVRKVLFLFVSPAMSENIEAASSDCMEESIADEEGPEKE